MVKRIQQKHKHSKHFSIQQDIVGLLIVTNNYIWHLNVQ